MEKVSLFQIGSTVIFFLAITHTFLTPQIYKWAEKAKLQLAQTKHWKFTYFLSETLFLNAHVEVIFGLWLIPLVIWFGLFQGWGEAQTYLTSRSYTHAFYITVIVVVVASRPLITFAERILEWIAQLGDNTPAAWWWTIMTIGPLMGVFLKEPGAMALSGILLTKKFYPYNKSKGFAYATMGLLFANVSVGGLLSPYSARALFIAAKKWDWDTHYMLSHFGWKMLIGVFLMNFLYYLIFRKNFAKTFPAEIPALEKEEEERPTPFWITGIHLLFVAVIAYFAEYAPIFIGIFIMFLGFHQVTRFYQSELKLQEAVLIGFFFANLILQGELQGWWVTPMLRDFGNFSTMMTSFGLSMIADNAIVSYLATHIPDLPVTKKYLLVAAAMSAGGLTVIANAPNLVGLRILRPYFVGEISFFWLLAGAATPSFFHFIVFWLWRNTPPL